MPTTVFFALRDAPERRAALCAAADDPERYRLFGLDEIAQHARVRHNLERDGAPPTWARATSSVLNRVVYAAAMTDHGQEGMGCTAEVVYIRGRDLIVGHVGDSRTYLYQDGRLILSKKRCTVRLL